MKDFLGNDLDVGDDVIFTEYNRHGLTRGKITKFSKGIGSQAVIEYNAYGQPRKARKTSDYIIKVVK